MPAAANETVNGRLQRGDEDLASRLTAKIHSGIGITFPFPKGTIITGELLRLHTDDRTIEFVVNSEIPEPPGDEATYDGRILSDHSAEPVGCPPPKAGSGAAEDAEGLRGR